MEKFVDEAFEPIKPFVYVLVSWFNPGEDVEILDVFETKKAAEQYIENKGLNPKYCDIAGYRVKKEEHEPNPSAP
jgi:hypothetical protein